MPDSTGALTEAERLQVSEFVNAKAKLPDDPCPVCGSSDQRVGDAMFGILAAGLGGMQSNAILAVPTVCHNCGFIRFFHAQPLGLIPPTKDVVERDLPEEAGEA